MTPQIIDFTVASSKINNEFNQRFSKSLWMRQTVAVRPISIGRLQLQSVLARLVQTNVVWRDQNITKALRERTQIRLLILHYFPELHSCLSYTEDGTCFLEKHAF